MRHIVSTGPHKATKRDHEAYSIGCLLVSHLAGAKDGLSGRLWLLLPARLLSLFALFFIRERGESGRRLAYIDVTQRRGERAHVVLYKRGVQRLVLMSFDDVRDDGVRERNKVLLGFGRRF